MQIAAEDVSAYLARMGGVGGAIASMAQADNHAPIGVETSKLKQILERHLPDDDCPEVNSGLIFVLGFCKSDVRFYLLDYYESISPGFTEDILKMAIDLIAAGDGDIRGAVAVRDSIMSIAQAKIISRMFGRYRLGVTKQILKAVCSD